MRTLTTIAALRTALEERRRAGDRVGFVPTMGFLHEGHLKLVDEARARAASCVMSIFVNPLQFGPTEDLARYPRDPDGDARKAESRGVDILFTPDVSEMYGDGERVVSVVPTRGASRWEGEIRPGHFAGVLTVVAKLFNMVRPDVAVFGQKDAQQAALVRAMVRELDFPLELVVAPIVRDPDGLALSSRNKYLDTDARRRALALPRALAAVRAAFDAGERRSAVLEDRGSAELSTESLTADYLAVVDPVELEPRADARSGDLVVLAARVGVTRLLDNTFLGTTE
jgi:pantoate--beta-alanine ligase